VHVSDDVAKEMERFPEVNWSEVCRKAIMDYVKMLNMIRRVAKEAANEIMDEHLGDYEHREKPAEVSEILG
jgi:DNA-binding FadR family transcriptional regulator